MEEKQKKYRIKEVKEGVFIPEVQYMEGKFKSIQDFDVKEEPTCWSALNHQILFSSKPTYNEALEVINKYKEYLKKKEELEESTIYHYID